MYIQLLVYSLVINSHNQDQLGNYACIWKLNTQDLVCQDNELQFNIFKSAKTTEATLFEATGKTRKKAKMIFDGSEYGIKSIYQASLDLSADNPFHPASTTDDISDMKCLPLMCM